MKAARGRAEAGRNQAHGKPLETMGRKARGCETCCAAAASENFRGAKIGDLLRSDSV